MGVVVFSHFIGVAFRDTGNFSDKPDFLIPTLTSVEFLEGDSALINATARGNPKVLSYVWIKDGIEVVTEEARFDPNKPWARDLIPRGPVLEFKTVNRLHAGEFTCEASNTVGSSRVKIIVSILCKNFSVFFFLPCNTLES